MDEAIDFQVEINDDAYFQGLARQNMDFHQSLGELVDNALSARPDKPHGEGAEDIVIEVSIEEVEDGGPYRVVVADHGLGIPVDDIINRVFNPGGSGTRIGQLNEHGFGLKNALALLTSGNSSKFTIMTRSSAEEDLIENGSWITVSGPWGRSMTARSDGTDQQWHAGLHKFGEVTSGTRVEVVVSSRYLQSIYRRGSPSFETLMTRLGEHLGVMFRYFINSGDELWLTYRSKDGDWSSKRVPAIPIPFEGDATTTTIRLEIDGEDYDFEYRRGVLDYSVKDTEAQDEYGWPYPLRIYYQGSNARCGIDIVVRDRLIRTGVFEDIWPGIGKTVEFNRFVGELRADDRFRTTNNKTGIDPHSKEWERALDHLKDSDEFRPEKSTRAQSEESLREDLTKILKGVFSEASVVNDRSVWGGGVDIDILVDGGDENRRVYELKVTNGRVNDLYQLQAGWDGMVAENLTPTVGILVCRSFSQHLRDACEAANSRFDANDNHYNFELREIEEVLPGPT